MPQNPKSWVTNGKKWTDEDTRILVEVVGPVALRTKTPERKRAIDKCAALLGRSPHAIMCRLVHLGYCKDPVERKPKKHGAKPRSTEVEGLYPGEVDEVRSLHAQGWNFYRIAEWIGCHPNAVARACGDLYHEVG